MRLRASRRRGNHLAGAARAQCRIQEVAAGGAAGRTEEVAFAGLKNEGPWYSRLAALRAMPDAERSAKLAELLARVDFVKATGFPAAWRAANVYGLLEYHRQHPYLYAEIETAREIKMGVVRASKRWFCDGNPATPPVTGILRRPGSEAPSTWASVLLKPIWRSRTVGRLSVVVRERWPRS